MPAGFKIRGIQPYELRNYPDSVKLQFWTWVLDLSIKAKDRDLARGLDAHGEPLRPIAAKTRKYRKSAMTPDGKGDPNAPPLMPGRELSRTRSLLAGRAFTTHCELYWRFDPFTFDSWSKILTIHKRKGRDVFGLSDESTDRVRRQALAMWMRWKKAGAVVPVGLEGRRVLGPEYHQAPAVVETAGRTSLKYATMGINAPDVSKLKPGQWSGGMTEAELRSHMRATAPANVQSRPGQAYNRILSHIWGHPGQATGGGGAVVPLVPKPPRPKAPPKPKPVIPPAPPVPGPSGPPVSAGLDIQATARVGRAVADVVKAIDGIHGDGALPRIPVKQSSGTRTTGQFVYYLGSGKPVEIKVSVKSESPRITAAHEIGHFLEHSGIPKTHRYGAGGPTYRDFRKEAQFAGWVKAIDESEAVKSLHDVANKRIVPIPSSTPGGTPSDYKVDRAHVRYLLEDKELWARAYAQYVATKSGNLDMMAELANKATTRYGQVYRTQWTHEDFKPIMAAIDGMFRALGWIK